jgi:hypothetical protein
MTNGALPSRNRTRSRTNPIWCVAIAGASALGWWGCTDGGTPTDPAHGIKIQADGGGGDDNDENRPPRITGGGRVDFPVGAPARNTRPYYQEFTFHFRIKKDNTVSGKLDFIDHRTEMQINGKPFRAETPAAMTFTPTAPDGDCVQGGGIVMGNLIVKNDGTAHTFTLKVCDNGEPGKNAPWDRFFLSISGYMDPNTAEPYHMHHHPTEETTGAYLTGGNIQAKSV